MDYQKEQKQQRVDLLKFHYQEWHEILLVEAEMHCFLTSQQRQEIRQFTKLDLVPHINIKWIALMKKHIQELDKFIESNGVKRQLIRDRHKTEKFTTTSTPIPG